MSYDAFMKYMIIEYISVNCVILEDYLVMGSAGLFPCVNFHGLWNKKQDSSKVILID